MRQYQSADKRAIRPRKPLNSSALRELALNYVARFATSSGKLEAYLRRKLRERGWEEDGVEQADADHSARVRALVEDFAARGYFDDEAYAKARSGDLLRRGYGAKRVGEALRHAGIGESIRETTTPSEAEARHAALRLAQKRRFGPFGLELPDRAKQEKQLAAMLRAGHSLSAARFLIETESDTEALEWAHELDDNDDYGTHEDDRFA